MKNIFNKTNNMILLITTTPPEYVNVVRCSKCRFAVSGKNDSNVICVKEKTIRDSDFFCRDGIIGGNNK